MGRTERWSSRTSWEASAQLSLVLAFGLLVALPQLPAADVGRRLLRWVLALTAAEPRAVLTFTRAALAPAPSPVWPALRSRERGRRFALVRGVSAGLSVPAAVLVGLLLLLPGNAGTLLRFKIFNLVNPASQTRRLFAFSHTRWHSNKRWSIRSSDGGRSRSLPLWRKGATSSSSTIGATFGSATTSFSPRTTHGLVGLGLWVGMLGTIVGQKRNGDPRAQRDRSDVRVANPGPHSVGGDSPRCVSRHERFLPLATVGSSLGLLGAYRRVATEEPPSVAQASPSVPASP